MGYKSPVCYSIPLQCPTHDPSDIDIIYFGMVPRTATVTANLRKLFIIKTGRIRSCCLFSYYATTPTNENISVYIRVNNTTDYLVKTVGSATSTADFSNYDLNVPVTAGDYIEMKVVYPVWATNAAGVHFGGYCVVECE